jgi:hypothetical protein
MAATMRSAQTVQSRRRVATGPPHLLFPFVFFHIQAVQIALIADLLSHFFAPSFAL